MSGRQGFDDGADWLLAQLAGGGASGSAPQASPPQTPPQVPSAFAAPVAPAAPAPVPPHLAATPQPPAAPTTPPRSSHHEEVLDWFSLAEPPSRDDSATRALPVIGDPGHTPAPAHPSAPLESAQPAPWRDAGFVAGAAGAAGIAGAEGAAGAAGVANGAGAGAAGLGAAALPPVQSGLPSWTPPFTVAPPAPTVRLTEVEPPVGTAPAAPAAAPALAPAPIPQFGDPNPMSSAQPPATPWQSPQASPVPPDTSTAPLAPAPSPTPAPPPGPVTPPASFALTWGDQELESEAALRAAFQQLSDSTASLGVPSSDPAPTSVPAPTSGPAQSVAPQAPVAEPVVPESAPAEPRAPIEDGPFAGFSAPAVARSSFTPVGGIPVQQPHPTAPPEAPAGWGEAPAPRAASYDDELWAALNEPEPTSPTAPATSFAPSAPVTPAPTPAPTYEADPIAPGAPQPDATAAAAAPSWTPGRAWTDFASARPETHVEPRPVAEPDEFSQAPALPFEYGAPAPAMEHPAPAYPAAEFAAPEYPAPASTPVETVSEDFGRTEPAAPELSDDAEPAPRRAGRFDAFAEELEWTPRAERRAALDQVEAPQVFDGRGAEASDPRTVALPALHEQDRPAEGMLSAPRAPFPAFAAAESRPAPASLGAVPPVDDLLAALGGGAAAAETPVASTAAAAGAAFTGVEAGAAAQSALTGTDAFDRLGLAFGADDDDADDDRGHEEEVVEEPRRRGLPFSSDPRLDEVVDRARSADDEFDDEFDDASEEAGFLWNLQPDPTAEDPRAASPGSVSAILAGGAPASGATAVVDEPPMSSGLGSLVRIPRLEPEPEPEPAPDLVAESAAEFAPEDRFFDAFTPRTAAFETFDEEPQQFGTEPFPAENDPWSAKDTADDPFGAGPDSADQADDGLAALFGSVTATGPLRLVDPSAGRQVEAFPATALLQTDATAQLFAAGAGAGAGATGGFAAGGSGASGGFAGGGQGARGSSGPGAGSGAGGFGGGASGSGGTGKDGGGKGGIRPLVWIAGGLVALLVLAGLFFLGTMLTKGAGADTPSNSPSASASETPAPVPTAPQPAGVHAWNTLFGGECLEPFTDAWQEEYTVVDCATPHAAQLVYRGTLPGDAAAPYPGEAELATQMNLLCTASGVINVAAVSGMEDLQVQASYPAEAAQWEAGARDYYCFANRSGGEPLTASIAGPGPAA
ncbi:septum formation family protein [Agromyces sp. NPDC057679]|uniref:septum formation family protein n=1 Tax=Agromyces sp. NPDC057679 TaxID=3346207 RepID=UPI00367098E7